MKTELLDLLQPKTAQKDLDTTLSLKSYTDFLKDKIDRETERMTPFFNIVLEHIYQLPSWHKPIRVADVDRYKKVFEMIYYSFSPAIAVESEQIWGLAWPFSSLVFAGTQPLYEFFGPQGKRNDQFYCDREVRRQFMQQRKKMMYAFVLRQTYGISFNSNDDVVYAYKDRESGLYKYFQFEVDTRFIELTYSHKLPELDFTMFQNNHFDEEKNLKTLECILPLDNFSFKGFSIWRIKDITVTHVLNQIKDTILDNEPRWEVSDNIPFYLKNLLGDHQIGIKLLPIQKVNGQLAVNNYNKLYTFLDETCQSGDLRIEDYHQAFLSYLRHPELLFYPNIDQKKTDEPELIDYLRCSAMRSLALIPIFFREQSIGLLMLFSDVDHELSDQSLAALNPAAPLLERLFKTINEEFDLTIDQVIKENFTALQPAVQWRFNEVAWDFIKRRRTDEEAEIKPIFFENVLPLYGDIDVRQSTLKRNAALQKDMCRCLEFLLQIFEQIDRRELAIRPQNIVERTRQWLDQINQTINSEEEYHLIGFLGNHIEPLLKKWLNQDLSPETTQRIKEYFKGGGRNGLFYYHRNQLEKSLQILNRTISNHLDDMNQKIQVIYSSYFEKFRTDGVEYDICVGSSINQYTPYDLVYAKKIKRLQLREMIDIARQTRALEHELPHQLQTTQLIFYHPYPIDISFRKDEHRFDVEGDSNIRYEMAKKRIEKIHIKGTDQRLSQPQTIAIVYFKQEDVDDIIAYLPTLQRQQLIGEKIEYLSLEDIKGLGDLKALRLHIPSNC